MFCIWPYSIYTYLSTYIIIDKSEIRQLLWIRISFDLHIYLPLFFRNTLVFIYLFMKWMNLEISNYIFLYFSFSNIGPMADLMSQSYLDKNSCYNSQVYGQNYSSHCYYGNMEYLSSGVSHSSLNVPSVSSSIFQYVHI